MLKHLLVTFVALLLAQPAQAKTANSGKSFLWKATRGGQTLYLLGSIHIGDKSFYPLKPAAEKAFGEATTLAVEANVDPTNTGMAMAVQVMTMATYTAANDELAKHIRPRTLALLKSRLAKLSIPFSSIQRLKPFMVEMTLLQILAKQINLSPEFGVDLHFLKRAARRKLPIVELEGIKFQMKLLAGFSDKISDLMLFEALRDYEKSKKDLLAMIQAWKHGDVRRMLAQARKSWKNPALAPVRKRMLADRNRQMFSKIQQLAKKTKTPFVVVGALHLVGKKGLLTMLKGAGYSLQQL